MAKRKRPPTPPVATRSAKESRDNRASRRAASQEKRHHAELVRLRAIRDQAHQAHRDHLTTLNAVDSPLLRLPAELRNMIFACVYAGTRYQFDIEDHGVYRNRRTLSEKKNVLSLSLVCRQVSAEASLLPYELGVFVFCSLQYEHGFWPLQRFLETRKPSQIDAMVSLKAIRSGTMFNNFWHQTRTAAYWVAKFEDLHVPGYAGISNAAMTQVGDIPWLGPSD